ESESVSAYRSATQLNELIHRAEMDRVNVYTQPVQPSAPVVEEAAVAEPVSFEPDDPIPEEKEEKAQPEKKRRPRFVDFFIKRKEND
ncbi:MAG: hypothetical protein IJX18_00550, partial [Clostridia bacterium]|nr:hypothetical protein [Clostridia bacterium]